MGTDGVIEVRNSDGQMFGVARLQEIVQSHAERTAAEIVAAVSTAAEQFHGDRLASDDATLLIIKRNK